MFRGIGLFAPIQKHRSKWSVARTTGRRPEVDRPGQLQRQPFSWPPRSSQELLTPSQGRIRPCFSLDGELSVKIWNHCRFSSLAGRVWMWVNQDTIILEADIEGGK